MCCLRLIILFVFLVSLLDAAWAPTCTQYVFVNGINTPQHRSDPNNYGAQETVDNLFNPQFAAYLAAKGRGNACWHFSLSYNDTQSFAKDLQESARLWSGQNTALDQYLFRNDLLDTAPPEQQAVFFYAASSTPSTNLTDTFALTSSNSVSTPVILAGLPRSEKAALDRLVDNLVTSIEAGNTAVCVGHSEGNFFCNLAYRIIREDSSGRLAKLGLFLPNERVLQIIGIADPADFTADGRNQYLTVCSDAIGVVVNSLPPNYSDSSCNSGWRKALWQLLDFSAWMNDFRGQLTNAQASVHKHLIATYLTPGTTVQGKVMQLLELSQPDPGCNGNPDCYLNDQFISAVSDVNWTAVGFPYSVESGRGTLTISSILAGQDPPTLLFNDGGGLATRRTFTGPFTASLSFRHVGGGKSTVSLKRVVDGSTAASLIVDSSPGKNLATVYPSSTAALPTATGFGTWHQIAFIKKDTQLFLVVDGSSKTVASTGMMEGYYLEIYSEGNNSLELRDLRVTRTLLVVSSSVGISPAGPYAVGQTLAAGFAIQNYSSQPVTLSKLVLGGRLNGACPNDICPDFSPVVTNVTIGANQAYTYRGTKQLSDAGHYEFFVAYQPAGSTVWSYSLPAASGKVSSASIDVSATTIPLTVSCTAVPDTILEGQSSTFRAAPAGGSRSYRYSWSGAVSGSSQNVGRAFAAAGSYKATVVVTDTSTPPQSKTAQCSIQVNGITPVPSAPSISGYNLSATPVANQPFSLGLSGSGFDVNTLQVWFFGLTTCQAGCRHPAAGVLSIIPSSASLVNVQLAQDTFRIKVRNGDSGPWSAASDPFQVQAATAPGFDLTAVLATKPVQAGQGVSFELRIASKNGFAGTVTWLLTGLPTGISITNSTQQVTVPGSGAAFSVNLQTSSNTPVGNYNLVATAKNGDLSQSVGLTLTVTQAAAPLSAACQVNGSAIPISVATGTALNYVITPAGGIGPYHYSWIGVSNAGDAASISVTPSGYASIDVSAQVSDSSTPLQSTTTTCPRVTINPVGPGIINITVPPGQSGSVTCRLAGPAGEMYVQAPTSLNGQQPGTYTLSSCVPPADFKVASITPSATQTLAAGGVVSFGLNLELSLIPGTIEVLATMNGQPYSGPVVCGFFDSPSNVQVSSVPFNQSGMPIGIYNLACAAGPPNSQLQSFSPSSSLSIVPGGKTTFVAAFVWATVTVYANPLPVPPSGVSWTWQLSTWQSSGANWVTQPVLTFYGVEYRFAHPAAYIEALKQIQNLGASGPLDQFISQFQSILPSWPPYTVVNLGPLAPTVSGYYWNNLPQNRVLFSGNLSGTGFISGGSDVWFCQTGTSVCYRHDPVGVAVNSTISISVYNVNLTTGSWQAEVRTAHGVGRGPAFNVQ